MVRYITLIVGVLFLWWLFDRCSPAKGQFPGHEYMPDMAHPISYEANVYDDYSWNNFESSSKLSRKELSNPRNLVKGTIPRGYVGIISNPGHYDSIMNILHGGKSLGSISIPINGNVPYYYKDTEEERTRASAEIKSNPFPITKARIENGKEMYTTFCATCHGDKADGAGYLVRDDGGKYPAAPANLVKDEFVAASEGRFYHALIYGKNVMGGYADKMSFEERWNVIHYIRSLQAANKKVEYSAAGNGLVGFKAPIVAATPAAPVK
jgi:mono/diheme cytochrome c family protein